MTAPEADLALVGGPCFTSDAARSWTDGVAVADGAVCALGAAATRAVTAPRARVC